MDKDLQKVIENRKQLLADEISKIEQSLNAPGATSRARLSEYHFTNVFLPFFAGDDPLPYKVNMQTWIGIAGGAFNEVDIVDNNNQVLFTVPAVLDRTVVTPLYNDPHGLFHVMQSARQYEQLHPMQGVQHITHELNKRDFVRKAPVEIQQHLSAWNTIFARYQRPPLVAMSSSAATPAASADETFDGFDSL